MVISFPGRGTPKPGFRNFKKNQMDYIKYKKSKEYIKQFDKERERIAYERLLRKNGDIADFGTYALIRLQRKREQFAKEVFLFNHSCDYAFLKTYLDELRLDIFQSMRRIRKIKNTNPELFENHETIH